MNRKVAKEWSKNGHTFTYFRKLARKRSKHFGDRVRSGLGIEKAIERNAGRASRGQDGAKIGPFFVVWLNNDPKIGRHPGDLVHSAKNWPP